MVAVTSAALVPQEKVPECRAISPILIVSKRPYARQQGVESRRNGSQSLIDPGYQVTPWLRRLIQLLMHSDRL